MRAKSELKITDFPEIVVADRNSEEKRVAEYDIRTEFEHPENPLEVDVGSGKGRFLVARAAEYPGVNFLGIERQYARVWKTARKIERAGLGNVRLARVEAFEGMGQLLAPESVATVYIFFPDPWPKRRHHRRRLVNAGFLDMLHQKLMLGGEIHFATDHDGYAEAAARVFRADERFEEIAPFMPTENERTDFELIFLEQGKCANRVSVRKR